MAVINNASLRLGDTLHSLQESERSDAFPNLADAVYERLWKRIVNLEFAPGTRLSDETLARELGVSRTPIREALYRLSQVGLVQVNARRGFFVTTLERNDVIELFDIRIALELFVVQSAVARLQPGDLEPLRARQIAAVENATSMEPADIEEFVRSDLMLHDLLAARAGNIRLRQAITDVKGQLSLVQLRLAQIPEHKFRAIEEHTLIIDALESGDAGAVSATMESHLLGVKHRVLTDLYAEREGSGA